MTFQENLWVPSSVVKNPKESLLSQYRIYIGKSGAVKTHSSVVSASRVDASGWEGGVCGSQCCFGERHSTIEEILTGVSDSEMHENTHMSNVGGRKRKESAIFD